MARAGFIPLLAGFILGAVTLQAQLPSNLSSGGLGPVGGVIGRNPAGHDGAGRMETHTHRPHRGRTVVGGFIDPFWYGNYYNEPVVIEREVPVPAAPPSPQIATPEPQRIPTPPKMTEIPAAGKAQSPRRFNPNLPKEGRSEAPLPPAVFVLASGERVESRHYLLTADSVQLMVDRKRRSIPLEALDLHATMAANRERGLDLQIPAGGSEVVLGF